MRLVLDSNALGERHEAVLGECDRPSPCDVMCTKQIMQEYVSRVVTFFYEALLITKKILIQGRWSSQVVWS